MKLIIKVFTIFLFIISVKTDVYAVGIFNQALNETKNNEKDTVETYDSDLVCSQLNNALQFLKEEKIFSKKFKMDYKIRGGWGYDYFLTEYLSFKLNVPENNVWTIDSKRRNKVAKYLKESVPYEDTLIFIDHCNINHKTKENSKWDILISKTDTESILVQFSYKKRPDTHGFGLLYLFFFNENDEVIKYYESSWIE